jgi:hypothetical protein
MSFTDRVVVVVSIVVALALGASAVALANGARASAKVATQTTAPTVAATPGSKVVAGDHGDSSDRESSRELKKTPDAEGTPNISASAVPETDQESESGD